MKRNLSNDEISSLCLELSLLLHAGVGVGDGLSLMSQESGGEYTALLGEMARWVDDGASLAEALRRSGVFPAYVCGLIEVGERSGKTEEALGALSRYYESRSNMDRQVRRALQYPAIMLVLMLAVVAVLLVKVLPIFSDVYASLGGRLTGVAGGLLTLGQALGAAMPVLWVLLAAAAALLCAFSLSASFREKLLGWWRSRMGDKGISRKINNSRLAQALSMGMASGLPVEESLTLCTELLSDVPGAGERCAKCRTLLEEGASLGEALKTCEILPAASCRLLELGQRSGTADAAMAKIAADLDRESEWAIEDAVSRVEPALVLLCSVLVGLILLSVMLPLTDIMAAIG